MWNKITGGSRCCKNGTDGPITTGHQEDLSTPAVNCEPQYGGDGAQ